MKIRNFLLWTIIGMATVFQACEFLGGDENVEKGLANAIIINYGDYFGTKSTITILDNEKDTTYNNYFQSINGVAPESNYQFAYSYDEKVFFMGNAPDKITWVNLNDFTQSSNGIEKGIIKPRYCVGSGNILYVSCWGEDPWIDSNKSYIAKVNLDSMSVTSKIDLPGGTEGLAIIGNKLYVALNYKTGIAVIDLNTEEISYIETPSVTSYFLKDASNNLYVSMMSTFSNKTEFNGLGYINTSKEILESTYTIDGISSDYSNILAANKDFSKIYIVASGWILENEKYILKGSVNILNTKTGTILNETFVEGVTGLKAIATDKENNFYTLITTGTNSNGILKKYASDGTLLNEYITGAEPSMMLFLN